MINPTNRFNLKNNFSAISKTHKEFSKLEFIKSMRGATISFLKMSHNFWRCSKKKVISYIRMPLNLITLMNNVRPSSRSYLIQTKLTRTWAISRRRATELAESTLKKCALSVIMWSKWRNKFTNPPRFLNFIIRTKSKKWR